MKFTEKDLSFLLKDNYDLDFLQEVYVTAPAVSGTSQLLCCAVGALDVDEGFASCFLIHCTCLTHSTAHCVWLYVDEGEC